MMMVCLSFLTLSRCFFFFSSRRRHTRSKREWSSDVCSSDLYSYSVAAEEERGRKEEAYDLIVKAWTEENPFSWHGEYFDYECVSILPRPLQTPHPPIWSPVSAVESFTWCARNRIGAITSGGTNAAAEGLEFFGKYAREECGWDLGPEDMG